jgi:hypothetical protein
MSRIALAAILATLLLAACSRTAVPTAGAMPDQKPALASPPSSMMTPQGY